MRKVHRTWRDSEPSSISLQVHVSKGCTLGPSVYWKRCVLAATCDPEQTTHSFFPPNVRGAAPSLDSVSCVVQISQNPRDLLKKKKKKISQARLVYEATETHFI
ncbi:hypothetical protein KP509_16G033500 [Ceratopteris richardii]|uniref:Uncharacterized protein n=1 Tax=Ceratopteris richardii TaxID=49495 RepID=A0A8T2SZT2_CERRI|nr:hypothetical protein KP509_16G033500 [Ceratopteris richardii]